MISWKMAAAWVAALVVTTVLTWQIVGLADSQVGDTPVAVAPVPTSTTLSITTTTTAANPSTSAPAVTSTTGQTTTTTPSQSSGSSTPTSQGAMAPPSTEPPTTPATVEWTVRTINSQGGTVIVRHRPGEVELKAATPAAGFSVEIDDRGPDRVRVEFEGEDDDVRVEVEWEDGELDVSIDD